MNARVPVGAGIATALVIGLGFAVATQHDMNTRLGLAKAYACGILDGRAKTFALPEDLAPPACDSVRTIGAEWGFRP